METRIKVVIDVEVPFFSLSEIVDSVIGVVRLDLDKQELWEQKMTDLVKEPICSTTSCQNFQWIGWIL